MELSGIFGVWDWFRREISGMVPIWFREIFLGIPKAVPLRFDPDVQEVLSGGKTVVVPEGLIDGQALPTMFGNAVVDVMYPARRCFEREVKLPTNSTKAIEKILALDTLRTTPFSHDEIYWSFHRTRGLKDEAILTQWIARREDINALVTLLKKAGLRVRSVLVEGNETGKPLLNLRREIAAVNRVWRVLNILCFLVLIGLLSYRLLYPAWQDRQEIELVEKDIRALRGQAVALRENVEKLRGKKAQRTELVEVINQHIPLVDVLGEVTIAMPDDVWISDLNYRASEVIINGSTKGSAARLVLDLANSETLQNPRLSGSVTTSNDQRERFELTFQMEQRQ